MAALSMTPLLPSWLLPQRRVIQPNLRNRKTPLPNPAFHAVMSTKLMLTAAKLELLLPGRQTPPLCRDAGKMRSSLVMISLLLLHQYHLLACSRAIKLPKLLLLPSLLHFPHRDLPSQLTQAAMATMLTPPAVPTLMSHVTPMFSRYCAGKHPLVTLAR